MPKFDIKGPALWILLVAASAAIKAAVEFCIEHCTGIPHNVTEMSDVDVDVDEE